MLRRFIRLLLLFAVFHNGAALLSALPGTARPFTASEGASAATGRALTCSGRGSRRPIGLFEEGHVRLGVRR